MRSQRVQVGRLSLSNVPAHLIAFHLVGRCPRRVAIEASFGVMHLNHLSTVKSWTRLGLQNLRYDLRCACGQAGKIHVDSYRRSAKYCIAYLS